MSWLFSRALVEEYSEANCLDGTPSAPLNTTPTPQAFLWRDKTTDAWNRFPSGMTCEPLTESRGEELLTWFRAGFLARTSAQLNKTQRGLTVAPADCGARWQESSARFDLDSFCWRTAPCLLGEDLPESSVILPKQGLMQGGRLLGRTTPDFPTIAKDCGWWATPSARDWKDTPGMCRKREGNRHRLDQLPRQVYASVDGSGSFTAPTATRTETVLCVDTIMRIAGVQAQPWTSANTSSAEENCGPDQKRGLLNPNFSEWLMGWPIGWTDLKPLATDKFQQWQLSHGVSLAAQEHTTQHND
jgi:hypothetical protein